MKKIITGGLALSFAALFALAGCGTGVDVIDYNDKLVDLQNDCYEAKDLLIDTWDAENYGVVQSLYPTTLSACTKARDDIAAMDGYEGDTMLRDPFLVEMQLEVAYLQKIGEIIAYWSYDELTEAQELAEEALWDDIDALDEQLSVAYDVSKAAQEAFAKKYGYELED